MRVLLHSTSRSRRLKTRNSQTPTVKMGCHRPGICRRPTSIEVLLPILSLLLTMTFVVAQDVTSCSEATSGSDRLHVQLTRVSGRTCAPDASNSEKIREIREKIGSAAKQVTQLQSQIIKLIKNNSLVRHEVNSLQRQVLAVQLSLPAQFVTKANCPFGYSFQWRRSCYMFVSRKVDWYKAHAFCQSARGYLAALQTKEEHKVLVDHLSATGMQSHFWTGGNDIAKTGQWLWAGFNLDIKKNDQIPWIQWPVPPAVPGKPTSSPSIDNSDNDRAHCIFLYWSKGFNWTHTWCSYVNGFICEFNLLL